MPLVPVEPGDDPPSIPRLAHIVLFSTPRRPPNGRGSSDSCSSSPGSSTPLQRDLLPSRDPGLAQHRASGWLRRHLSRTGIVLLSAAWRGSWVLDEERVGFQPRHGRPKSLDWSGVERVLWRTFPVLKGRGVTIKLSCIRFSKSERREALGFVESKLSNSFDLKPVEPIKADPPVQWDLADTWTKLLVFDLRGSPLGHARHDGRDPCAPWQAVATLSRILWWFMGLLLICGHILVRHLILGARAAASAATQSLLRRHPAWPWRLRRETVTSCQKQELSQLELDDWSL